MYEYWMRRRRLSEPKERYVMLQRRAPMTLLLVLAGRILLAAETAPDKPAMTAAAGVGSLELQRQDYGEFRINRSVLDTPLQIGTHKYDCGLGTHSFSRIAVRLSAPAKRFAAAVGIDNNHATQGKKASVVVCVEVNGKMPFESEVLRGGAEPVAVDVDLDGAKAFALWVLDGDDGPSHDQADWCDPVVTFADGRTVRLDTLPLRKTEDWSKKRGARMEMPATPIEKALPGQIVERWTLATADTAIVVGATDQGQLCVVDLRNTDAQRNWMPTPSVFAFVGQATVDGERLALKWQFRGGLVADSDGRAVTLRFACSEPALELESLWQAFPGRGPVRHSMIIRNTGRKTVSLGWQPTLDFDLARPAYGTKPLKLWTFHSDGGRPDPTGVYQHVIKPGFTRHIRTSSDGEFIPYAVIDGCGQGVYVGVEWSYCQITASALKDDGDSRAPGVRLRGGNDRAFYVNVGPQETFHVPPGFVGAYKGDVDDAGNGLRKYLLNHNAPDVLRSDPTYPKVQWNAYMATSESRNTYNCVESKYYPFIDAIAPLGYEEVMIDVGWWDGPTRAAEPEADPVDWPSGMAKAAEHAHRAGLRFGLYWNKGEEMADQQGRRRRMKHVTRLYREYNVDMWRSDNTGGPVVGKSYASVKGFYEMLDQLADDIPSFQWENCGGGGRIKDFGAMKRAVKIFNSDKFTALANRQAFHDSSFMFPPMQLLGHIGRVKEDHLVFLFRSCSMGAPEWFLGSPANWTEEQRTEIKKAVLTYKTRIRPLVRAADLYHVFPRPNGRDWDGIQYHDPKTGRGVVYIFKPADGQDSQRLRLRGLDIAQQYRVTFGHSSNPDLQKSGRELMEGLDVTLKGAPVSELMFTELVH